MSTEQNYVGKGSHANNVEQTAQNGPSAIKSPPVKAQLSFDLALLTHSGLGSSEVETLIWALATHHDYQEKELVKSMSIGDYLGAYRAKREGDNLHNLLVSVALQATYLAERNYWAHAGKSDRDGFSFEQEQQAVADFLKEYTSIDPVKVSLV